MGTFEALHSWKTLCKSFNRLCLQQLNTILNNLPTISHYLPLNHCDPWSIHFSLSNDFIVSKLVVNIQLQRIPWYSLSPLCLENKSLTTFGLFLIFFLSCKTETWLTPLALLTRCWSRMTSFCSLHGVALRIAWTSSICRYFFFSLFSHFHRFKSVVINTFDSYHFIDNLTFSIY